jgi:rare lipoprotein A
VFLLAITKTDSENAIHTTVRIFNRAVTHKGIARMKSLLFPTALLIVLQAAATAPATANVHARDGLSHFSRQHHFGHNPHRTSVSTGAARTGVASYYWEPQHLASGGWFNPNAMTAAHKTLPFGTRVRVTHLGNGRSVDVRINDRGPYVAGRVIDLSKAAAGAIGMSEQGTARIKLTVLGR